MIKFSATSGTSPADVVNLEKNRTSAPLTSPAIPLEQGFVVVGFKFDTMVDTEDPVQFVKKIGVRYPLAVAADDLKQKFGGIEGLPTTMLYDRHGILRKKVIGFEYTDIIESEIKSRF